MNIKPWLFQLSLLVLIIFSAGCSTKQGDAGKGAGGATVADPSLWEIKDGKFYLDGSWQFLKIAKPLRNFGKKEDVDKLIGDLDILQTKNYTNIEINCYWHHFDFDGDGNIDVSLDPLNRLIDSIYAKGMYPCLSVETYAVGGGQIPEGFWERYPDAYCINDKGKRVTDTEYGFNNDVISIYHEGYRQTVHRFIQNLAKGIDTEKILYFETTVEPQYMGAISICYSAHARSAYEKWRSANNITDASSAFPSSFPMPQSFVEDPTWNRFRAQFLGKWVSEDAAAYRSVAGADAYVAVDYLDAAENTMMRRNGVPVEFLSSLEDVNIIQVNWSWYFPTNSPNQKAYDRVNLVKDSLDRDWAVTEHMTFNGSDFVRYDEETLRQILENTLRQGTRFGWEFVNVANSSKGNFSMYNDDWSPKRVMRVVDDYWEEWMEQVKKIESGAGN